MTKPRTVMGILGLMLSLAMSAQNKQADKAANKIGLLPTDLEIQLALSALPPHLREMATVHVLNSDKGFEVAHQGTNGFHPLVVELLMTRSVGLGRLNACRDDILYPVSFDDAGAKAQMRVFLDAAQIQAKGPLLKS